MASPAAYDDIDALILGSFPEYNAAVVSDDSFDGDGAATESDDDGSTSSGSNNNSSVRSSSRDGDQVDNQVDDHIDERVYRRYTAETCCEQILECQRQISRWKRRLEGLQRTHDRHVKLAKVTLNAKSAWRLLSREEQLDKEFVLAAMSSPVLPDALQDSQSLASDLRNDRDIYQARIRRDDHTAEAMEGERIFIPPTLRGDKEVLLRLICLGHGQSVVETMKPELRDEEELLLALLDNETLPNHFMQHFSISIRENERLMLKVLAHPNGLPSMSHMSPSLRNDKRAMLFALAQMPCSPRVATSDKPPPSRPFLKYVSNRLQDDREVVRAALGRSGLDLKYAAVGLRRDFDMVHAACRSNPAAFRYCLPSPTKQRLLQDIEICRDVVFHAPRSVVRDIIARFPHDEEIMMRVLERQDCVEYDDLSSSLRNDAHFLKRAVNLCPFLFLDLPGQLQQNMELACSAIKSKLTTDDLVLEISECSPNILNSKACMLAIAQIKNVDVLQETLQYSPHEIRDDDEVMMQAVTNDSSAYDFCSERLQENLAIAMATVSACPSSLYFISDTIQLEYPEIIMEAIKKSPKDELWLIYDDIREDAFLDKRVALAWIRRGGDWLEEDFPQSFQRDEELLLALARHNHCQFDIAASDDLKSSKKFMLKAVKEDGRVIVDASDDLLHDFDIALVAFSENRGQEAIEMILDTGERQDFKFIVLFAKCVREKLELHNAFVAQVLCAIQYPSSSKCCLSMLDQGPETSAGYKQLIASFVGIPLEDELRRLRRAHENLLAWGI